MKKLSLRQRRVIQREIDKRRRMQPKPKEQPKEQEK